MEITSGTSIIYFKLSLYSRRSFVEGYEATVLYILCRGVGYMSVQNGLDLISI